MNDRLRLSRERTIFVIVELVVDPIARVRSVLASFRGRSRLWTYRSMFREVSREVV